MTQNELHELAVQTDTKIADMSAHLSETYRKIDSAKRTLARELGIKTPYKTEIRESLNELLEMAAVKLADENLVGYLRRDMETTVEMIAAYREQAQNIRAELAPLEAIYDNHQWSRFFLVKNQNGHIHSSMNCHSCNVRTQFGWLPNLSGLTEKDAVEAHGSILCTHCYPSAPVEWTNGISKAAQAEKDERAAAKAERDAKKAAKGITNPDGSPLIIQTHGYKTEVRTLVTAQRELVGCFKNGIYYPDRAQAYYEQAVILAKAIGHKTGDAEIEEILTQAEIKATKSVKKERGY